MCQLLKGVNVDFLQFLDGSCMEVSFPYLAINDRGKNPIACY
jgi:hypothetical protein